MKPPRQATSVDEIIPRPNPEQGVDPEAAAEQRRFGGGAYTRLHIAAVLELPRAD
jgi:hypothetical protein